MSREWDEIKEGPLRSPPSQENMDPLGFLPPAEWHLESQRGRCWWLQNRFSNMMAALIWSSI